MIPHTTPGAGPIAPPRPRLGRLDILAAMHREEIEATTWQAYFADPTCLCWLPLREVAS
jgi:hypothetical protein